MVMGCGIAAETMRVISASTTSSESVEHGIIALRTESRKRRSSSASMVATRSTASRPGGSLCSTPPLISTDSNCAARSRVSWVPICSARALTVVSKCSCATDRANSGHVGRSNPSTDRRSGAGERPAKTYSATIGTSSAAGRSCHLPSGSRACAHPANPEASAERADSGFVTSCHRRPRTLAAAITTAPCE